MSAAGDDVPWGHEGQVEIAREIEGSQSVSAQTAGTSKTGILHFGFIIQST